MKLFAQPNPARTLRPPRASKRRLAAAMLLVPALLTLNGCLITHHQVNKVTVAPHLMDATLDQLLAQMNKQYRAVDTFTARVNITATTGGPHTGKVTEYTPLEGIIILRKPADLHVVMLKPFIRSRAIEMVSDGKNFKLIYSDVSKTGGYEGPDVMVQASKNGLENLRPNIIRDALQVPAVQPEEYVEETTDSRIVQPAHGKTDAIEEPDYDINFLKVIGDHHMERVRVVHISRVTLLPYRQDIYQDGRLVTVVDYENYQKFGDVDFPMSIAITRPLDEYSLKITVNKLALNDKVDDEQFVLNFPEGLAVKKVQ